MSTKRKGKWGPRGTGPNGRRLCYCGCGEELPATAHKLNTSIPGHYDKWAAVHNPATVRRLVEERDRGVCAACGVDTELRAREADETRRLFRWLAVRHADELLARGELPFYPGFTPSEKRYSDYVQTHERPARPTNHDAYKWANHWTAEQSRARFGETTGAGGHTWEADHIIPVVEGGGECDLSNYRTLCLTCHRKATAALAKRRAERRRDQAARAIQTTQPLPLQLSL